MNLFDTRFDSYVDMVVHITKNEKKPDRHLRPVRAEARQLLLQDIDQMQDTFLSFFNNFWHIPAARALAEHLLLLHEGISDMQSKVKEQHPTMAPILKEYEKIEQRRLGSPESEIPDEEGTGGRE